MSDLEKIYAYANQFRKNIVLQLRWEGAGDCEHPATIFVKLKDKTYEGTTNKIKFHAVLNLYESNDSEISETAESKILKAFEGATADQTYEMWGNVDVTRASRSLEQSKADLMFIRNIMLTSDGGDSLTSAKGELKELHVTAVRARSNSIGDGGQLRLGMSGAPGLISASNQKRQKTQVKYLFVGAPDIFTAAKDSGLEPPPETAWGRRDVDKSVNVMKNDGTPLGKKPTYYLTFVR